MPAIFGPDQRSGLPHPRLRLARRLGGIQRWCGKIRGARSRPANGLWPVAPTSVDWRSSSAACACASNGF